MRLRCEFDAGSGVCLWADDGEARDRWDYAVDFAMLGLAPATVGEGERLLAEWDAWALPGDTAVDDRTLAPDFNARVGRWLEQVRRELGPTVTVVRAADQGDPRDGPVTTMEGTVVACFASEASRTEPAGRWMADTTWRATASWMVPNLRWRRDDAQTPQGLLRVLSVEPGFLGGWWQLRDGGPDLFFEGDPVEHAMTSIEEGNVVGLANFLGRLEVRWIHLAEARVNEPWRPSRRHRNRDGRGSWLEWWAFFRNATRALKGEAVPESYLRKERDRLFLEWTFGGVEKRWPAHAGEALERAGWRRESFATFSREPGS